MRLGNYSSSLVVCSVTLGGSASSLVLTCGLTIAEMLGGGNEARVAFVSRAEV